MSAHDPKQTLPALSTAFRRWRQASLHPALKGWGIDVAPDEHHAALGGGAGIGFKARTAATKLKHEPADRPIKPDDPLGSKNGLGKPFVQPCLKSSIRWTVRQICGVLSPTILSAARA